MATYTAPPYFPQSSLSTPSAARYRKFKVIAALIIIALVALLGGAITGVVYLIRWLA
jgi:hypothetical protein